VTAENRVRPGEHVIAYLTGMIGTLPPVPTGQLSPTDPLAVVLRLNDEVYIDDYRITFAKRELGFGTALPEFMGLVPGLIGVYQVNFRFPARGEPRPGGTDTELDVILGRQHCGPSIGSISRIVAGPRTISQVAGSRSGWDIETDQLLPVRSTAVATPSRLSLALSHTVAAVRVNRGAQPCGSAVDPKAKPNAAGKDVGRKKIGGDPGQSPRLAGRQARQRQLA
jgi:hypothetical protein